MLARTMGAAGLAICFAGFGYAAVAAPDTEVVYFSGAQLKDGVAKTEGGIIANKLPVGKEVAMSEVRRDADGVVEVHLKQHDVIIPQGGHATILVGGKVEGNKESAPDEWRGGKIIGGVTHQLNPGDVIWIPAGTPHQMLIEKGGSMNYIAFKFDMAAKMAAKPK